MTYRKRVARVTPSTTRKPVAPPETVQQFLAALFRGLDEGPMCSRGGR